MIRKQAGITLLTEFEQLLSAYFSSDAEELAIPKAGYFASKLNLSPNYLSDMWRSLTGQGIQQHIQQKMMDKAKNLLASSDFTVSQIAYKLGYDYPQSLHKQFKIRERLSPLQFREKYGRK